MLLTDLYLKIYDSLTTTFQQILTLFDALDAVDTEVVVKWVKSLQQADGSFYGDKWGQSSLTHMANSLFLHASGINQIGNKN